MKFLMLVFLQLLISLVSNAQKVENVKLGCSPKTQKNSVLKQIGSEKFKDFSDLGTSWSFIGTQKIIAKNGEIYLKGDIYSPRGGQLNVIEHKYDKPIYILKKEWYCNKYYTKNGIEYLSDIEY
jgi:hypothetical protein